MELKKTFIGIIVLSAVLAVLPQSAFGIGQTTDPVIINDALRGGTFQKEMIVINTDKEATVIAIESGGDIAGWVKFFKINDLKNPITSLIMKAGERSNLFAQITIPKDKKNGKYSGVLSVIKKPKSDSAASGSSSAVSQKIDRKVDIKVNDKENIALRVSVIPEKYDLADKESLKIRLIYDNQGNVSIKPEIRFKIKKDEKILFNINYPFSEDTEAIKPKAVYEIPSIEVPTATLAKGNYAAEIDFVVDEKIISTERFKFTLGRENPKNYADDFNKKANPAGNSYNSWIIPGLAGVIALMFMAYGFFRTKNKTKDMKS